MQEHPVLDVLSATNHGGQAALFVCLVKLIITISKNQVTCRTLNLHVSRNAKTVYTCSLIAASENHIYALYRVARDRISGLKAVSMQRNRTTYRPTGYCPILDICSPFEKRALFQSIRFIYTQILAATIVNNAQHGARLLTQMKTHRLRRYTV